MKQSYWEKDTTFQNTDLLIVGAGIVGLSTALFTRESNPKLKITIVDSEPIAKGASSRNAGFGCFGSMTELLADVDSMGEEAMISLVQRRWEGLQMLQSLVPPHKMDWKNWGGKEVFFPEDTSTYHDMLEKIPVINKALFPIFKQPVFSAVTASKIEMAQAIGQIKNSFEGQLHPGKMIQYLRESCAQNGIEIIGGLGVKNFVTQSSSVVVSFTNLIEKVFSKVIFATNGFSNALFPNLEIHPARNLVLLTAPIKGLRLKGTYHYQEGYIYFRNVENRVLLGGGRHWDKRSEETTEYGTNDRIKKGLNRFLRQKLLPEHSNLSIAYEWSGILGVGPEKNPIVEMLSDRVGVAIRMGGMGVAIGSSIGKQASQLLL